MVLCLEMDYGSIARCQPSRQRCNCVSLKDILARVKIVPFNFVPVDRREFLKWW